MDKEEIKLEYQKAFNERFKTPNGVGKYEHWAGFAIDDFIAEFIVKKFALCSVGSSNDLIVVELSDEEIKIITRQELEKWKKDAMEFDGFEGWIVRGILVK